MAKFCVYCGKEVEENDNVCGNCGKAINNNVQTVVTKKKQIKLRGLQLQDSFYQSFHFYVVVLHQHQD